MRSFATDARREWPARYSAQAELADSGGGRPPRGVWSTNWRAQPGIGPVGARCWRSQASVSPPNAGV